MLHFIIEDDRSENKEENIQHIHKLLKLTLGNKLGQTKADYGQGIYAHVSEKLLPGMDAEVPCRFEHDGAVHQKLYASATADRYQADRSTSLF